MLPSEIEAVAKRESADMVWFVRVGATPVLRFTTAPMGYVLPDDDDIDPSGFYRGGGRLLGVPNISSITGTEVQRSQFVFAVTDETLSWILSSGAGIDQALIDCAILYLNADMTPAGPVLWLSQLTCDVATYVLDAETGGENVVLSAHSGGATLRQTMADFWNDVEHRQNNPGDLFLDHMTRNNALMTEKWPADG